jgi:DNA-binding NarL/FixJ family response regulator
MGWSELRVLIADDSEILRDHLRTMLAEIEGIEIVGECNDTDSTLDQIKTLKPDTIILDIRMPGEGGIFILNFIKSKYPKIKVIIFTDYPYPQYRTKCLEIGADYFFDKSTESEKMIEVFKSLAGN